MHAGFGNVTPTQASSQRLLGLMEGPTAWQARMMHTQARGVAPTPEVSLRGFKHASSVAHCLFG